MRILDAGDGSVTGVLRLQTAVLSVALLDGFAATASFDGCVRLWSIGKSQCIAEDRSHTDLPVGVYLSQSHVISIGYDGSCCVWQRETKEVELLLDLECGPLCSMALLNGGAVLAAASSRYMPGYFGEKHH